MNRNSSIDSMRLIAVFCILTLHTGYGVLPEVWVANIRLFSRFAVPFYFIVSGYFFEKRFNNDSFLKSIERLMLILFNACLIYAPLVLLLHIYDKVDFEFNFKVLLTGIYFHLWFIGSLIFGYTVIWFVLRNFGSKFLILISAVILFLALLFDSYDATINREYDHEVTRFLQSIPFLYIGFLISSYQVNLKKGVILGLGLIGLILQYIEGIFLSNYYNVSYSEPQLLVGTVIFSIAIFLLTIKINTKENVISRLGKNHSLLIYLYHPIIYIFIWSAIKRIFPMNFEYVYIFNPLIAFFLTLLISILIEEHLNSIFKFISGEKNLRKMN